MKYEIKKIKYKNFNIILLTFCRVFNIFVVMDSYFYKYEIKMISFICTFTLFLEITSLFFLSFVVFLPFFPHFEFY